MKHRAIVIGVLLFISATCTPLAVAQQNHLSMLARVEQAMNGEHRSEANRNRNAARHPIGTLEFFQLRKNTKVMEIWPGAGWYSEILAPALRGEATFTVASYDPDVAEQPEYRYRLHRELLAKFEAAPELYDQVNVVNFSPPQSINLGPADSQDLILSFRSMHGWYNDGQIDAVLAEFYRVLRPGGVLGVVQHRADEGADVTQTSGQGYVPEAVLISSAKKIGFNLQARSEVNANPRDEHDHPEGVWTLPPTLALGDEQRDHYRSIGESDRMTLRFVKPRQRWSR